MRAARQSIASARLGDARQPAGLQRLHDQGWGWQDNGYGIGVLGPVLRFATGGVQTIRIQAREDGVSIDQVVLSPSTYLTRAPGALRNDTTILPKQFDLDALPLS